jgi:hypothetical protein
MSNKPNKPARKGDRHTSPRVAFYLPDDLLAALKELAKRNDRTLTKEVILSLRDRLTREGLWEEEKG